MGQLAATPSRWRGTFDVGVVPDLPPVFTSVQLYQEQDAYFDKLPEGLTPIFQQDADDGAASVTRDAEVEDHATTGAAADAIYYGSFSITPNPKHKDGTSINYFNQVYITEKDGNSGEQLVDGYSVRLSKMQLIEYQRHLADVPEEPELDVGSSPSNGSQSDGMYTV